MCGIVGAIAERNVVPILMEGLRRLEYRGYDSAGIAIMANGGVERRRRMGKVAALQACIDAEPVAGELGISPRLHVGCRPRNLMSSHWRRCNPSPHCSEQSSGAELS